MPRPAEDPAVDDDGQQLSLVLYENSFDAHKNDIIFMSDRASGANKAPHEDPHYNLFRMNLDTGEITQLTDEPASVGAPGGITKRPIATSSSIAWGTRSKSSSRQPARS